MKIKLTMNDLFFETYRRHWKSPRFIESGWAREVEGLYSRNIIGSFGHKDFTKISAKEIRNWHHDLKDTPIAANRALNVMSKMFSYAEEQELIPQGTNPCKLVKSHKERKRRRYATPDELKKIFEILKTEEVKNPRATAFIYLLIYSGARPRSIERAKWQDLKMVEHNGEMFGVLTFNGKTSEATGEDEQVVIPPQGLLCLKQLDMKSETICGIKMPRDFWERTRTEAGCSDLWIRDLRRTFASIGLSTGQSSGIIGELLNHKSANTTKTYTQLLQDKKLEVTHEIAKSIQNIIRRE